MLIEKSTDDDVQDLDCCKILRSSCHSRCGATFKDAWGDGNISKRVRNPCPVNKHQIDYDTNFKVIVEVKK